jgi:hypothetical protein
VPLPRELELDPVVDEPFALEPLPHPDLAQEIDGALLEDAGANALLDVLAAPVLEDDGIDPLQMEEVRQHEPGGTGTDDPDLSAF